MTLLRSLHIVQIGSDDSVFDEKAPSDTLRRQLWYGEILSKKRPNSRITNLIITKRLDVKPIRHENVFFIPVRSIRFIKSFLIWMTLIRLHNELAIDVISPQDVDSVGWLAPLFGKLYAVPSVAQINYDMFSPHSIRDHMGTGVAGWLRKKLTFFFLRRFSAVRVVGKMNRSIILEKGLHHNVAVIPVAVTSLESPRKLNQHIQNTPRVLYVGRLSHEKNLLLWLDIAKNIHKKNPSVEFDIVGVGPMEKQLREKAHALEINNHINFHGFVLNENLPEKYCSASIFLLTSYYEGLPRVLVEASSYGLPCLAPNKPWAEDVIVDQETGYLYNSDNAEDIADKALLLIESTQLRLKIGKASEEYVSKNFAPRELAEAWVDWLIEATAGKLTIPPLRPTFKRWKKLSTTQYSILRGLEYETISALSLNGRVLDIGGGRKNSYYDKIKFLNKIDSVNIDFEIKPTFIADLNISIPIQGAVYDHFISLNTFEHIEKDTIAIREAFRVLKPGGTFHIIVPFLYKVHGSPFDYHRHTSYWWSSYIQLLGILPQNIRIEPLVWDAISSSYAISEYETNFRGLRKKYIMLLAVLKSIAWKNHSRMPYLLGDRVSEYALGYYIHGKK